MCDIRSRCWQPGFPVGQHYKRRHECSLSSMTHPDMTLDVASVLGCNKQTKLGIEDQLGKSLDYESLLLLLNCVVSKPASGSESEQSFAKSAGVHRPWERAARTELGVCRCRSRDAPPCA